MKNDFFRLRVVDVTGSTNEDLKEAAAGGEEEGLALRAKRQTQGKGRQGRAWDSPEGNLYLSLLLRPLCSPSEAGAFSFLTALAVRDVVRHLLPEAPVELKWPNDVLVGGKKISGILLEASEIGGDGKVDWLVVGTGINVGFHPEGALYPTTSLVEEGAAGSVEDVASLFLDAFAAWREVFLRDGFEPLRASWLMDARKGRIVARMPSETLEGDFSGLDEAGRLRLLLADGSERRIAAADIFFATKG